ncbi:short chain dehydrogenase [Alloactinosynnema sp. L-07]|uniref:SDR family oxidoreductase n=1 Tax=Alloactinosynnema sp. L-07 TaxID=1653480 RepID=UPI00065F0597|nr:SDR family oxidoreductase [Alloactinosynnema sp. L-07]CRK57956.1 short chain dehydrogenase [Alloactinosynnema sp. L-07]
MRPSTRPAVIAVTGGARGIGLCVAKAFAATGAKVGIGDLDADGAEKAAAELPTESVGLPLDVSDSAAFATFLDTVESTLGPLDVLVNNAGVMLTGEFLRQPERIEAQMLAVNLHGVLTGSRLAGTRFAARGRGHIVNIASLAGVVGLPGVASYAATKFGVVGFSQALRAELRPTGVRVSTVLPGVVNTELSQGLRLGRVMKRMASVEPEQVAEAVVRVVAHDRPVRSVPRTLGVTLRTINALPERLQIALAKAMGGERGYLDVDQAARDSYHHRATGGQA